MASHPIIETTQTLTADLEPDCYG
ncbi:hypothetical protein LCGC14_3104930, partial [marine sediment metagenome]